MKFLFSCLRSAILSLFGLMFLLIGVFVFHDAVTLLQARNWPVVAAHLDRCTAQLRYSKNDASWQVTADFSYGVGLAQHFEDIWSPDDSPTYTRSQVDLMSASEASALIKRFCDRQVAATLRVSPSDATRARRSEAVDNGDWKGDLGGGVVCVLMGVGLGALAWSLLRGKPKVATTTRGNTRVREPAPRTRASRK